MILETAHDDRLSDELATIATVIHSLRDAHAASEPEQERAETWALRYRETNEKAGPLSAQRVAEGAAQTVTYLRWTLLSLADVLSTTYGALATSHVTRVNTSVVWRHVGLHYRLFAQAAMHLCVAYRPREHRPSMVMPLPVLRHHIDVIRPTLEALSPLIRQLDGEDELPVVGQRYADLLAFVTELEVATAQPVVPEKQGIGLQPTPAQVGYLDAINSALRGAGIDGLSVGDVQTRTGLGRNTVYDMLGVLLGEGLVTRSCGRYSAIPARPTDKETWCKALSPARVLPVTFGQLATG
ncbi:hypothetical protein [Streptomyces sp. NPDC051561]|uniref:hypothetical protein n=1 Tax=Streptomyces sp. NPDC051561 TaxID=3365658 RepID=UPI003795B261